MGKNTVGRGHDPRRSRLLAGVLALGAAATVAACSSSPPGSAAGSPSSASVAASVTISEKTIPGAGTVLEMALPLDGPSGTEVPATAVTSGG